MSGEDPRVKYGWVEYPAATPIDPATAYRPPGAYKSYEFIPRFNAKDTNPVTVVDEATQNQRDCQVVAITRSILGEATSGATDEQVLNLWRSYMAGAF